MNNEYHDADEVGFDLPDYFPVLTTLAKAKPTERCRTLSALGELSFIAGRAGDEPADWESDIDGAIAEAFGVLRPDRRARVKRLMREAFDAGVINNLIDAAEVPAEALDLARAYALIHEYDIQFECERQRESNHFEAQDIAYRVACRCNVEGWQAAKAAIAALAERGLNCLPARADEIVGRGTAGRREREARNAYRESDKRQATMLAEIFDEEIGQ